MSELVLIGFLVAHGLLHLAIWLPHPRPDADPPPFHPDHSAVLTAVSVAPVTARRTSVALAALATGAYLVAALAVGVDIGAVMALVAAAALGLLLKTLFFHPWLVLGVLLDLLVLTSALAEWPVTVD